MATVSTVNVPIEIIKLARQYLDAQRAGQRSQKEWRRAESLRQLLDAKLQTIEKAINAVEKPFENKPEKLL